MLLSSFFETIYPDAIVHLIFLGLFIQNYTIKQYNHSFLCQLYQMPLQLVTSSAALNHMITGTASSKKKLEVDSRTDDVRPPKKLRSRKHIVEALENQESPRPSGSGKARVSGFFHLMPTSCFFLLRFCMITRQF